MTSIIEVRNVSKCYPARRGVRVLSGRGGVQDWIRRRNQATFEALHDVSLDIEAGSSLGIIGRNGSGKSTLLKLLAGVTLPTRGEVIVRGRMASLLELGAGFHPMLTGRENIYLNAGLLGMRRTQADAAMDAIIDFSGIREFIDQPVDTYSSGMYVRIAFSVAVHVNPDVFLVDEVLAVGDEEFQRRCRAKIGELKEQGKTIVFVSHDLGTVSALCDRVVLMDKGRMINRGSAHAAIDFYLRQIGQAKGIHSMTCGPLETVFSHGRAALFLDQREITAPAGIRVFITHAAQTHDSALAEWEVGTRGERQMTASGLMPRLPLRLLWECRLESHRIVMDFAFECLRDMEFEMFSIMLHLPCDYTGWFYGGREGEFPPLLPGHVDWTMVTAACPGWLEAAVWPGNGLEYPMIRTSVESDAPYTAINLLNSDYMAGARVVNIHSRMPRVLSTWKAGRHPFARVALDVERSRERFLCWKAKWEAARIIVSGALHARMGAGCIELSSGDQPISNAVHLHTQILIANLWTMSQMFRWSEVRQEDGMVCVAGESQRFPLRQHWAMRAVEKGIFLQVYFEPLAPLDVQEYNVSLGLVMRYDGWATEHETAPFPPIPPEQEEYRHLNRDYRVSSWISASGLEIPRVRMAVLSPVHAFHMTAINAEYALQTRVLQAIRTPERGARIHYSATRHLAFEGTITLADE